MFKPFFSFRVQVNYIYYGLLLFGLALIHGYQVYLLEGMHELFKGFFVFYAVAQSILEVSLFILAGHLIKRYFPAFFHYLFITFITVLFLVHVIDFPLQRLMDLSVWEALSLVLQESYENFIEMLYATHVTMFIWIAGALLIGGALLVGILFYAFCQRITEKYPVSISVRSFALIFSFFALFFLAGDRIAMRCSSSETYRVCQKVLPWKRTLSVINDQILTLKRPLHNNPNENRVKELIAERSFVVEEKPDIFLFVIESLRDDFINEAVAPQINQLRNQSIHPTMGYASANATQFSWFSIFFGQYPFYFSPIQEAHWQMGSPALQILKKMGYQIEVLSSVRLAYYKMDQLLFGRDLSLADQIFLYPHDDEIQAYQSDRQTMDRLIERATNGDKSGGRCFIVFLESTHFDYSWDTNFTRFKPYTERINYMGITFSTKEIEGIKNRYRNAVHYIDTLYGEFAKALKAAGLFDESIIALTGDHGEEFFESGHLFHASGLNRVQTSVPLLFKLGKETPQTIECLSAHVDIFPTLFHYLMKEEKSYQDFFDGESLLKANRWPYALSARYNGSRSPYEFCLYHNEAKVIVNFSNPNDIFASKELRVLATKDHFDQPLSYSDQDVEKEFGGALQRLFSDLQSPTSR